MYQYFDIVGKVAWVTGAGSGIGKAAAMALAEQGALVAIGYHRNEEGAEDTKNRILSSGARGRAITVRCDVTKRDEVQRAAAGIAGELGPIDILVNNAGSLVERLRLMDLSEARWDDVVDLNLKSAFLCTQAIAGAMVVRKTGVIINVVSIAGRNGGALGSIHYSTAKGGLITMTKGLAKELAPHGIRVNAISPGVIDTPFHEQFSTPETMKAHVANIPLGRVGTPAEVANAVVFLASGASSYIVGETLEINGGMLMD